MSVKVTDCFEISSRLRSTGYEPGLVVVLDWMGNDDTLPVAGDQVTLTSPAGATRRSVLGEIKCHGPGRSFYLPGLKSDDAPIGSEVSWAPRSVGPRTVDELGRLLVANEKVSSVSTPVPR